MQPFSSCLNLREKRGFNGACFRKRRRGHLSGLARGACNDRKDLCCADRCCVHPPLPCVLLTFPAREAAAAKVGVVFFGHAWMAQRAFVRRPERTESECGTQGFPTPRTKCGQLKLRTSLDSGNPAPTWEPQCHASPCCSSGNRAASQ